MTIFNYLRTLYALTIFCFVFFIIYPVFLIAILYPEKRHWTGIGNRFWSSVIFTLSFIPYKIVYKTKLDKTKQYIFCANHFSYLDIASMGFTPGNVVFVGKNDMERVPLFGFMYRNLHITVNRSSLSSKYNTLVQSLKAVDAGKSLIIFPEGGIVSNNPPNMAPFKDGAFRIAIEKQIPIVPVTLPYNWILLPDNSSFFLRWGLMKIIFHEPIYTTGFTLDNLTSLKEKVHAVIEAELKNHLE